MIDRNERDDIADLGVTARELQHRIGPHWNGERLRAAGGQSEPSYAQIANAAGWLMEQWRLTDLVGEWLRNSYDVTDDADYQASLLVARIAAAAAAAVSGEQAIYDLDPAKYAGSGSPTSHTEDDNDD